MSEQRERFEAWATKRGMPTIEYNDRYWSHDTHVAWQAWLAACPEGWQAVPKEATPDMQEIQTLGNQVLAVRRWRDTLAVAPKPEDV